MLHCVSPQETADMTKYCLLSECLHMVYDVEGHAFNDHLELIWSFEKDMERDVALAGCIWQDVQALWAGVDKSVS
jgi:hypothetical protein